MKVYVKRTDYLDRKIGELDTPAAKVHTNLYQNAATFVTPPFTEPIFGAMVSDYTAKYNAYKDGGATAHSEFITAEENLLGAMNNTAYYVDSVALGNRATVILSGFEPTKETQTPRTKPAEMTGLELNRGASGELTSSCDPQEGVDVYVAILTAGEPLPASVTVKGGQITLSSNGGPSGEGPSGGIIDFSKKRKKTFEGLTPTVRYYVTYFGINSGGVGQLCAPVMIVCN